MRVPAHLSHLRRDRRGLPVPYVNRWGPEDTTRTYVAPDDDAWTGPSVYIDDTDQDAPDFTAHSPQRQRLAVARGLCQVCRAVLPWPGRRLVLFSGSVRYLPVAGLGADVPCVEEPWLCTRCADFATTTCPALIRAGRAQRGGAGLLVAAVSGPADVAQVATTVGLPHLPEEGRTSGLEPVMWLRIALVSPRLRRLVVRREDLTAPPDTSPDASPDASPEESP